MNLALQLVDEHGRKYLTADERRRFIVAAAHVKKPADQTFVLTIAHTGARVSEVMALRALDVDLDAGAVSADCGSRAPDGGDASAAPSARPGDLERQQPVPERYRARQGWTGAMIADAGAGMNDCRPGLRKPLAAPLDGSVGRLVATRRDRLLRFGAEPVFAVGEAKNVEVVVPNPGAETSLNDDRVGTVAELVAVGAARLCGDRSHRSRAPIEAVRRAVVAPRAYREPPPRRCAGGEAGTTVRVAEGAVRRLRVVRPLASCRMRTADGPGTTLSPAT